jgi:cobalt-precorrin-7 (C5)-methyltransferase
MAVNRYPILIIGCGPGSAEHVTPAARKAVEGAQVLIGARRLLDLFPDAKADRIPIKSHISQLLDEMETLSREKRIAVLVTGDPGLLSLAKPVIDRFGRQTCKIIAGISSIQVAFAVLGLDWHDALIVDAHGSLPQDDFDPDSPKIAVFTGNKGSFAWIASLADRLGEKYRGFVCSDLTLPGETIREIVKDDLASEDLPSLSIVIFVKKELIL